jgi:hypothetical protein
MFSMYPQKMKSMGVKSRLRGGQLFGPPLPIHRPRNSSFREVRTMAQNWTGAPSYWEMRPSTSVTICGNTNFSSISRLTALVMVLLWKKLSPTIRSDMMSHHTLALGLSRTCSSGHVGSHCPKSCNCGGLQHRVCEKWPRRRPHDRMTPAFMQSQLVAVWCCHLSKIRVTKTWTDFALYFRNVPNLWLSSE